MRTIITCLALAFAWTVNAQTFNTGDAELDADLGVINANAKVDLDGFKADLSATFGVSTKNLDYMVSINMEPADMYFALEIAASINKPVEVVIDAYEKDRSKGWGYIAQQLGIKPGSPEFHALKGKSKEKKDKSGKKTGNGKPIVKENTTPVNANPNAGKKK